MAEEVVRRRRVVADPTNSDLVEDRRVTTSDDGSAGLGVALAVALAILAILALIAVGRGFFVPAATTNGVSDTTNPAVTPPPGTPTTNPSMR